MSDESTNSNVQAAGHTKKTKSSASAIAIIGLLALGAGGGIAWYMVQRGHSGEAAASTGKQEGGARYIVPLEGFTVNLADPEETHFLRVTLALGLGSLPGGVTAENLNSEVPVPRVRDSIVSVLTVCKADALLTPEGKSQLKKNLLDGLRRDVPELDVRDIYFTEFLVQR